jgi:hypothetical protein
MTTAEDILAALDQQAETLATTKDQGNELIEITIDRIAEEIAWSLRDNPDITDARIEQVFDEMLSYVVEKSGVFIDS